MNSNLRPIAWIPLLALLLAVAATPLGAAPRVRVKDLTAVEGVRSNPLIGYGLVVGLQGTGDGTQAAFTIQSLANVLRRSGIQVPQNAIRVRNVAAVMVTAELPPFARSGQQLDVQVASMGDAKSLQGGTLLMTPLAGPDGQIYAVAQGGVSIGGAFLGGGGGNSVQRNHPTAGRVPSGATVEREVPLDLAGRDSLRLLLNQADFLTAARVAEAVNSGFGMEIARAEDPVSVRISPPEPFHGDLVGLLARVQAFEVRPDVEARVVINERTGTVVMGAEVRVSKIAVAHGNLTVEIQTDLQPSQPAPLSGGETVVLPQQDVILTEESKVIQLADGVSVGEVVEALNMLGVSARDMIAIFQSMHAAGALHAKVVVL
ncbi:flagellar basal body P-ring biosynthesis protein FlgA [Acidobacteria bacterium Mor1]|nr:flagellar basal body P-ring biosynthesis protein FlgA [Acidobacteria bacterium Mor1]